jgi:olfactory receptor
MSEFLIGNNVMSYNDCAAQMVCFTSFASVENYLLASMAYDCYAAVCKPLHYTTTLTMGVCIWLVIGCYVLGFLSASIYTGETFGLSFCETNVVHHFCCDIPAVMVLSCSDRRINEMILVYVVCFNIFLLS